jgi:hypothetical protein
MAVNKVEIYVSQILEDLDNGLTWLKRDDLGYGSIQDKYNAKDQQIAMIRKHPALKDAETTVTVFTVIDDTKTNGAATLSSTEQKDEKSLENVFTEQGELNKSRDTSRVQGFDNRSTAEGNTETAEEEELSAFANL